MPPPWGPTNNKTVALEWYPRKIALHAFLIGLGVSVSTLGRRQIEGENVAVGSQYIGMRTVKTVRVECDHQATGVVLDRVPPLIQSERLAKVTWTVSPKLHTLPVVLLS